MILKSFFSGQDVFAQLPTGYGKSLVFQAIPDMCLHFKSRGFAFSEAPVVIVACPLQSIISDQILFLKPIGINAANIGDPAYNSDLLSGNIRIIFGSPESLGSEACRKLLTMPFYKKNVVALVCDEVHTVTQW
jgi:ATP-dependent DNA helicase RecQ